FFPDMGNLPTTNYRLDCEARREFYLNYGANNPGLWFCPSGLVRNNPAMHPSLQDERRYVDRDYTGGGEWESNHREVTDYGYFVGPGRGFTGASAVKFQ